MTSAVAALPKPKPGWEGSTKVGGVIFYNFSDIEQKSNGNKIAPSGTGFDIKRTYISIDHAFNDTYSADITTDASYNSSTGTDALYIKKAYVQGYYGKPLTVRLGAAELPWVPFVENLYGYRYVENVLIDRTKFGTSTDWGAHVFGSLLHDHLGYAVSVVDGAGYKVPGQPASSATTGRTQSVDVEARVNANIGPFTLAVGGYDGKLGKDPVGVNPHHVAQRFDAVAAYVTPKIRLGVEYFSTTNYTAVTSLVGDKSNGYSGFGSYAFYPKFSVFARYDWVKPTGDTVPAKRDEYYNFGINFEPVKVFDISLVYKHDSVINGSFTDSNGTIGGTSNTTNGDYNEFGIFGQVKY